VGEEGPANRRLANDAIGFLKGRLLNLDQNICLDVERTLPDVNVQVAGGPGTQLAQAPVPPDRSVPETGQGLPALDPPGTGPGASTTPTPTPSGPGGTPTPPLPTPVPTLAPTPTPLGPTPTPGPTATPTIPPAPTDTPIPLPTPTPVCTTPPCP
jgi:hypothetical protein